MLKRILTQNKCNKDTSLNVTEDSRVDFKSETEKVSPMTHKTRRAQNGVAVVVRDEQALYVARWRHHHSQHSILWFCPIKTQQGPKIPPPSVHRGTLASLSYSFKHMKPNPSHRICPAVP